MAKKILLPVSFHESPEHILKMCLLLKALGAVKADTVDCFIPAIGLLIRRRNTSVYGMLMKAWRSYAGGQRKYNGPGFRIDGRRG